MQVLVRPQKFRFAIQQFPALLLLLLAAAILSPDDAFAQAAVAGTVASVSGAVQIQRGGTTIAVTQGMPVQVGDRIVTGADGQVSILLTDQSTIDLADSSTFTIDQHAGTTTRLSLLGGRVRSFVNRTAGATPNFEVHTPNAVAAARGTTFILLFFPGPPPTTNLEVLDGIVKLANINNLPGGIDVQAGYKASVVDTNDPSMLGVVTNTVFPWPLVIGGGVAAAGGLAAGILYATDHGGSSGPASPSK